MHDFGMNYDLHGKDRAYTPTLPTKQTMNKLEKAQTTFFIAGAFWFSLMSTVWIMWFFGLGPYTTPA